jgi:hypothetical protein
MRSVWWLAASVVVASVALPGSAVEPLQDGSPAQPAEDSGPAASFHVRFEGEANPELARAVVAVLRDVEREYRERLGFGPRRPLTVILQNGAASPESRLPDWADGLYDGDIRVPAAGLSRPTERLVAVLRHELAHSFVDSRTRGNCPAWLQEGLSQWLEGAAPDRDDGQLAELAREGQLPALLTLEAPFLERQDDLVPIAYGASLSATAHILRTRGVSGIVRLLESLGAGLPAEEALPNALGMTYRQLQESWGAFLVGESEGPATPRAQGS